MTLADKHKVIEVLLCCGQDPERYIETTGDTASSLEASPAVHAEALRQWRDSRYEAGWLPGHGAVCIEAAYRLIESSPTLRREWFGAR